MIDTHCHLHLPEFDPDRDAVLARSRRAGVNQWVVPGIQLEDFPRLEAVRGPGVHWALGLHPLYLERHPADALSRLAAWVERLQPVALGEIGLDFLAPEETIPAQLALLEQQLALAASHGLPVLLHVRKAHDPVLHLLRRMRLPAGGIVHAFNGSVQQGAQYLQLGFRLGVGGVAANPRATRIRGVIRAVPEAALVLETDSPFMLPAGLPGTRNEPANMTRVAVAVAELRAVPVARVAAFTSANARAVLRLPAVAGPQGDADA